MTVSADQVRSERGFIRPASGGPLWLFLRGFLKHPVMVGSVIPSSKILIDKMLAPVDWANCKLFVEYGPGVGTFTQHILDRLAPDATLLTIDTNEDFTDYLNSKITDSRLASGDRIGGGRPRDHGRAGLRRGRLHRLGPALLDACRPASARRSPPRPPRHCGRAGRSSSINSRPRCASSSRRIFSRIDKGFEWRNVPPATLFWAWKD